MARELVTYHERLWIRDNAVIQMGSKIKYDVMDVDKVAERISKERKSEGMTPWVEIQPISEDMHKSPNRVATFQKDPKTGVLYGIAIDQDEFGNIRWQKIQLHDHLSLNLDKRDDSRIWAAIRFHPDIQGSPWQKQAPYYKIYDPVEEARKEISEVEQVRTAFLRVEKLLDNPKSMVHFARFLGEDLMENANHRIVKGRLLAAARNHPFDFNQKWESKARSHAEHYFSAKSLGIIESYADRGLIFRGIALGFSDQEAIKFLSNDSSVMNSVVSELEEKDVVVQSVAKTVGDVEKVEADEEFS